jgi:heme exporter protein A
VINASQLSKSFGRTAALRGINLAVARGEAVALLGPNGAGKTTLLRILATLDKPSAGALEIAGLDALRQRQRIRALVGLVAHHTFLHPQLTVSEELRFYGRLYGLQALDERIAELLDWADLAARRGVRVGALSRGQQQRLAIARALLHDPPLLLLDEPDTGLDQEGLHMLDRLLREGSRTIVFSSHNREWASGVAGRAVMLEAGRIAHA